jgi:hypothetical protein
MKYILYNVQSITCIIQCTIYYTDFIMSKKPLTLSNYQIIKLSNDILFLNILITFYSIVFQNEIYIIYYTYNLLHVLYNVHSIIQISLCQRSL